MLHLEEKCELKLKVDDEVATGAHQPSTQVNQALSNATAGNKVDSDDEEWWSGPWNCMFHGPWMWMIRSIVHLTLLVIAFTATILYYMWQEEQRMYKSKQWKTLTSLANCYFYFLILWFYKHMGLMVDNWIGRFEMQSSETLIQQLDQIQDIPKGTGPNKALLCLIGHVLGIGSH